MSFKLIIALASIGCLKGSADPGVITCKCTGPGCEDPAACECPNIPHDNNPHGDIPSERDRKVPYHWPYGRDIRNRDRVMCKITVMDQGSSQNETFLTCEGPGCKCECPDDKSYGGYCGCFSQRWDRYITCTTGINSTEWTVSGYQHVYCRLIISGAQVTKPDISGIGPDIASDETFSCRPAHGETISSSCTWSTRPEYHASCIAQNTECEIMSVGFPRVLCRGKACLGTQASDGVLFVSSTQKGAVTTVSSGQWYSGAPLELKYGGGVHCRNPTDRDGDCLCSNELGGMCYSSKDKGSVGTVLNSFGYYRTCRQEIFAAGCTRSAE